MASFFEESLFFGMAVSLIAYGLGLLLKKKLKWAFLNPLLLSIIVVILFLRYSMWTMRPITARPSI